MNGSCLGACESTGMAIEQYTARSRHVSLEEVLLTPVLPG